MKLFAICGFSLCATSSVCLAEDWPPPLSFPTFSATGLYLGAAVGRSKLRDGQGECNALASLGITVTDCKDISTGYRLFAGYMINTHIGLEGGYYDAGKVKTSGNAFGVSATADAKATVGEGVVVFALPIGSLLDLYAKGGMVRWNIKETASAAGLTKSISDNGWAPTYGFGTNLWFSKMIGLQIEARRYEKIGDSSTTGKSDVDFFSAGAIMRF